MPITSGVRDSGTTAREEDGDRDGGGERPRVRSRQAVRERRRLCERGILGRLARVAGDVPRRVLHHTPVFLYSGVFTSRSIVLLISSTPLSREPWAELVAAEVFAVGKKNFSCALVFSETLPRNAAAEPSVAAAADLASARAIAPPAISAPPHRRSAPRCMVETVAVDAFPLSAALLLKNWQARGGGEVREWIKQEGTILTFPPNF